MPMSLDIATINLATAVACGALIGSERQIRQRMAGLRTNALVALGAASFVVFSAQFPNELSPTRVAAQVVSGIGFLGAGIIFRDGFNVHGLNTAATLWCSAAVGILSGAGAWAYALIVTALVVFVNLGLRPLVKWLKTKTRAGVPLMRNYQLILSTTSEHEAATRALLVNTLSLGGLHFSELSSHPSDDGKSLELSAIISGEGILDREMEVAVARIGSEPGLLRVRWHVAEEG